MSFPLNPAVPSAFEVLFPVDWQVPALFSSPHSGRMYPDDLLNQTKLSLQNLRKLEDCFVDELFSPVISQGAPLIRALLPRAFLDLNREAYELDQEMFAETLPSFVNSRSQRVAAGLGTIPRFIADNKEIYRHKLSLAEAQRRLDHIYHPYHHCLSQLLAAVHARHSFAVILDCHSMPSHAARQAQAPIGADIVLGDNHGRSCNHLIIRELEKLLRAEGLRVIRNIPYAGGFITQHYGTPLMQLHAIQIEVNRQLYMNEATFEKTRGFKALQASLAYVTGQWLGWLSDLPTCQKIAAE